MIHKNNLKKIVNQKNLKLKETPPMMLKRNNNNNIL